jgi:hypothetical protein
MSTREPHNGNGLDDTPVDLSDLPPRHVLAQTARLAGLTWNRLDAFAKDFFRWRAASSESQAVIERGVLELVAASRDHGQAITEIRAELARDARASKTEEQLAALGLRAGEAFIVGRAAAAEDQLAARKESRALVLTGARRVGVLVAPLVTAAVAVLVTLMSKGC